MTRIFASCASARDQHELALAAADLCVWLIFELRYAQCAQCRQRRVAITLRWHRKQVHVRRAAHQNCVHHRERKIIRVRLRHVSHCLSQPAARPGQDALAVQSDVTTLRFKQAEQGLEQGGLAAAVGTQYAQDLAGLGGQANVVPYRFMCIAERQIVGRNPH